MKLNKKSKIFIFIFFLIILIPVIIIGTINYAKEQKLQNRIKNSKSTKILTLNNISTAITLDKLFEIETSKEYTIEENQLKYKDNVNKDDFTIKYTNTSFYGSNCIKEYYFVDENLSSAIFDIDTSHWMPKDIYEELVKLNGEPDETDIDKSLSYVKNYTWYGKNGTLVFNQWSQDNLEIRFQIEE